MLDLFVPGRVCLFGEHSDWAAGYRRLNPAIEKGHALITGTLQGIRANVGSCAATLVLTSVTPDGERHGPVEIPMDSAALRAEAERGGFFSYIAGVAGHVLDGHPGIGGLTIDNYLTDLPVRKGLSSSAAICVLAARAFNRIYDLGLDIRAEMEIAYQGERRTPSCCGRMDQGCAFGTRPVLMTFDGDDLETREVGVGADLYLVLADLGPGKDTRRILSALNEAFPDPKDDTACRVQDLLGPINRSIVGEAVEAVKAGDAERLGGLMRAAQEQFDRYAAPMCPEELTAPVLHRTLAYRPFEPLTWGGKGIGSQGDGAAQFVARGEAEQRAMIEIIARDLRMPCMKVTLREC
jgi:hypothetical protein